MKTALVRAVWGTALGVGLLFPSHVRSIFDGIPLDGRTEAILVGLAFPVLVWLEPQFLDRTVVRVLIIALLGVKAADAMWLTPEGLCARFSTDAPYSTDVLTIPIEEPRGALRSWDVRADMRADAPMCTAIVRRPWADVFTFPAWFVNLTDFATSGRRSLSLDLSGFVHVVRRGLFVVEVGQDMSVNGTIGSQPLVSTGGNPMLAELDAGTHRIDLHATLTGSAWRFVPTWNGRDAFTTTELTLQQPRTIDGAAGVFRVLEVSLVLLIATLGSIFLVLRYRSSPALLAWCVGATCVFAAVGVSGRFERVAVLALAGAALVPVSESERQFRTVLLLVGVPWLALIAARSLPLIAHFTAYSNDDWLAYQAAGYRIFMHGYWLEGGSKVFDYQPLYRWIAGAWHLVFGDSSVGETYWDAICLLLGAGVTFVLVERAAGFRWGVLAAVATLATVWIGTIWYFVGRGLSEIAAAGWGFIAALLLLDRRAVHVGRAASAALFAVLMF
ncbi:MAG TPA: hypothetical protein VLV86_19825, partial [Vicinamibacterales bacterium]|nr:hypothetical protein [Vicinamibacterales bacterium]